jgi:hypothetical protein
MLLSAVASINSMASFQATERMSASKSREAEIGRFRQADKLAAESAQKTLAFAGRAKSSSARDDYIYANQEAIKAFRDSKVQVQIAPDAGAELWASLSGWTVEKIQMVQAAYLAILLILLKMVCFQAAGFFLNPLAWAKSSSVAPVRSGNSGDANGGDDGKDVNKGGNIVPLHPAERSTPAVQAGQDAATPAVERPVPATPQRSVTPVASAPWSDRDVDALLKQRPLMAVRPTWRQLGEMTGWDHTTLFKRGQRLTGKQGRRPVLGQHRQQHRHQEGAQAFN